MNPTFKVHEVTKLQNKEMFKNLDKVCKYHLFLHGVMDCMCIYYECLAQANTMDINLVSLLAY